MRHRLGLAGALLAAVGLASGLIACGGGDDGDGSPDVPDGVVAVVGDRQVTEAELDRQAEALKRAQRGGASEVAREQLEQQALATLLQLEWLEQEAEKRGIEVDMADVRRRWRAIASSQFKTKKALRRFLGGQREVDVLRQLRLQELTERIQAQVGAEANGDPERAVKRYQRELTERVREATTCGEGYTAPSC